MAESNDPSSASPEEPKTEKPAPVAAPTEGETVATTAEENAPAAVSPDAGDKPAAPEARPAVKPVKKSARKKSEEPAPAAAAPENLSLSADVVGKQKIVKAKGSKNVHSGIAHVLSTFNNTIVTITDGKGNRTVQTYDLAGNLWWVTQPKGGEPVQDFKANALVETFEQQYPVIAAGYD